MEKLPELPQPTQEQLVQYEPATYAAEATSSSVEPYNPVVASAHVTQDAAALQPEAPAYQVAENIVTEAPVDEAGLENLAAALAHKRAA